MAVPIWKDYFVSLGTGDAIQFRIILDDTDAVIYSGKAYCRPGESSVSVKVNDICADYLQNVLPTLSQADFSEINLPVRFVAQAYNGGMWNTVQYFQFLMDWSYDYGYDVAVDGMSFPINGHFDPRMPLVWTGYLVNTIQATIRDTSGSSYDVYIPIAISDDFNADFNADFSKSTRTAGSGTAVFLPSAWSNVDTITINGVTFRAVQACNRYALYYVNAYGGWDTFLIEGNTLETDSLTRHDREMEYDNSDIQNRGIRNYVNEVAKGYQFHSGWLTDQQAGRMHHLINSPDVYLYDIVRREMIPVTVTDTACDYKTFRNQGNRLVNYTINVQVAQNRIRR